MWQRIHRGFTVIEAIVVVSVIIILVAILIPTFGKARAKAYGATCAFHLSQVDCALQIYARDYGGKLPPHYNAWDALMPYIRDSALTVCPTELQIARVCKKPLNQVPRYLIAGNLTLDAVPNIVVACDPRANIHNDGAFLAFADGHVKWVHQGRLLALSMKDVFEKAITSQPFRQPQYKPVDMRLIIGKEFTLAKRFAPRAPVTSPPMPPSGAPSEISGQPPPMQPFQQPPNAQQVPPSPQQPRKVSGPPAIPPLEE
ncbi:MAG TPA: hypothetical protein EYP10_11940 [Armatimonadetes bacterium]|nr:hypothetical protein [Armatimonadota bacterium]